MVVQRVWWRMMEHVRVRAGWMMMVMMVMAAGHHTGHGSENAERKNDRGLEVLGQRRIHFLLDGRFLHRFCFFIRR